MSGRCKGRSLLGLIKAGVPERADACPELPDAHGGLDTRPPRSGPPGGCPAPPHRAPPPIGGSWKAAFDSSRSNFSKKRGTWQDAT